ncbi:hypothetical protein [Streptomyces virginiae]|uniref:hypothetical protein n=1 Tax=Streptomyces virginiae TaxID=1961 RepID=UPI002DBBE68C|nr:hypothetical protein [Streptomyces sp. CMAA1738]MEC4573898.1 hypothetical protein [Streptomyces sp. CMAA1738]
MSTSQRFGSAAVEHAEAVLVEQYPRLVRLAYLTLPDSLGRHTRVLLAHKAVQRALPRPGTPTGPAPAEGGTDEPDAHLTLVRTRVLRATLTPTGPAGGTWAARIGRPPVPPFVWGLRLWPPAGGIDEVAQTLSGAPAPVRAAFVLHHLDDLTQGQAERLLGSAGAADPAGAVRDALALPVAEGLLQALRRPEFDASVVSARPTDLLRRRRRARAGWTALATLTLALTVLSVHHSPAGPDVRPAAGPAASGVLDPARLQRVPAEAWADTARVDFTAWPARGGRTGDRDLLARALRTWAAPGTTPVTTTPGTTAEPPARAPQLLYAGELDGRAVVLLRDADRVVRYGETATGSGGRTLDVTRTDDAGVTTAAALTLSRAPGGASARYLLAPWIATAATRDLLRAGDTAHTLTVAADGVTAPAAVPPPGGACASWPVLELTSSTRIVEKHSFVLTDLGALSPVHLTYTPLPDGPAAAPARQPREATGPEARAAWAPLACRLGELRAGAYRAVNVWDFAAVQLPDGAGRAVWSCTRASGWAGPGDVTVRLRLETGTPQDVARARSTAACGRFGQHLLAGFRWRSPAGRWYLLAAGSRQVTGITATGAVRAGAADRTLAAPWPGPAGPVSLMGTLAGGGTVTALDGAGGGRD